MLNLFKKSIVGLACCLTLPVSYAIPTLPNSAQPQEVSRALLQQSGFPQNLNTTSPADINQPYSADLNNNSYGLTFPLNGIRILNAKSISEKKLYPLYADKLHQRITLDELLAIVGKITNYYRSNGYLTSQAVLVPQRARKGIVTIRIVEGYIDQVYMSGNPKKSAALIAAYENKIQQHQPYDAHYLERYLLLANELPGTQVTATLTPSPSKEDASDLTFDVQHQRINGFLSYDNYGTRYIGPQQITGNIGFNSFLVSGDSGQVTSAKTPRGNELTFIDANYSLPINTEGNRLLLGATSTKTQPLFVLQPANIIGLNKNYYASMTFPHIRELNQTLTYVLGFNYNDTRVTTFNHKLYADDIRSLGFGFLYENNDRLGNNSLFGNIRQGLPILGHTTNTNPLTAMTSRPGGSATYTKIDLTYARLQPLGFSTFSLYGLFKGQYGFQGLLVAEQFAYGGSQLGRGYDPAELLGDKAMSGSLELRYDWAIYKRLLTSIQLYGFYELGKVWNYAENPIPSYNVSAASTGAGVRFLFTKHISGNLWLAKPLTKAAAAETLVNRPHNVRGFFSVVAQL